MGLISGLECTLKIQESALTDRENTLKIKLLQEEKDQLKKEVDAMHQKLKDQNEINAVKTTRLEERLKNQEEMHSMHQSIDGNDYSMLSFQVPASGGFGRSRSPRVGHAASIQSMRREHTQQVIELQRELSDRDNTIKELLMEKEELEMRLNELANNNDYLNEQIELINREKETTVELLETQIKRQENEYLQQINVLDSEKRNAKNMLSHLQNVIKNGDGQGDSVKRKLNFSVCLNRNDSNKQLMGFNTLTTPNSPQVYNSKMRRDDSVHKITSGMKCRSRNPSNSGLKLVSTSVQNQNFRSGNLNKDMYRSGQFRTLKELANHHKNMNSTQIAGQGQKDGLEWFEKNIESTQNDNGFTLDSSHNHTRNAENPYKRSHNAQSKGQNTSDGGKGHINYISEIQGSSKGQSDGADGTLMTSIVNLFPHKFRSKPGSGRGAQENDHASSFTNSLQESMSKIELKEKLERIKRTREDSRIQQLRQSDSSSSEVESDSPEREIQAQNHNKPQVINKYQYNQMLEMGEIMKNVNGDVLCKKCNREFTIDQLITDETHWKMCLKKPIPQHVKNNLFEDEEPNILSEDDEYVQPQKYHHRDLGDQSISHNQSSIILVKKEPQFSNSENDESFDDDGEYEEDIEEGIAYPQEHYELNAPQGKNTRYQRSNVYLETVEQESDECKSSICDSTNYISQPKMFNPNSKPKQPSMRYHSQTEGNGVGQSLQAKHLLNQSPLQCSFKHQRTQVMESSGESNKSKASKVAFNKSFVPQGHQKGPSEVSVRLFGAGNSGKAQSPRPFKDITHQDQEENYPCEKRKNSVQVMASKKQKTRRNVNQNSYLGDCNENLPIGFAEIDLMQGEFADSSRDSLGLDKINKKLHNIEGAVQDFYRKAMDNAVNMQDNYNQCMSEVGNLKGYIELKSEKKANSRMQSVYSNQASAMKTPIQTSKMMEFNISSRKNTPLLATDGMVEIGQHTSQRKGFKNLQMSRDITQDGEFLNHKQSFNEYMNQDEYGLQQNETSGRNRKGLSRNNSSYGHQKMGLNRYNSQMSQSTTSMHQPAARSFALHL